MTTSFRTGNVYTSFMNALRIQLGYSYTYLLLFSYYLVSAFYLPFHMASHSERVLRSILLILNNNNNNICIATY